MSDRATSTAPRLVVGGEQCPGIGELAPRCREHLMQSVELAGVDRETPGITEAAAHHRVLTETIEIVEVRPHAVEDHLDTGGAGIQQYLRAGVEQLLTTRRPGHPQTCAEVPTRRSGKCGNTNPLAGGQDLEEVANAQGALGNGQQRDGTEWEPLSQLQSDDLFIGYANRVGVIDLGKDNAGQPALDAGAQVVAEISRIDLIGPHPEIRTSLRPGRWQPIGDDGARPLPFVTGNSVLKINDNGVSATAEGSVDPRGPVSGYEQHRPIDHADVPPPAPEPNMSPDTGEHLRAALSLSGVGLAVRSAQRDVTGLFEPGSRIS